MFVDSSIDGPTSFSIVRRRAYRILSRSRLDRLLLIERETTPRQQRLPLVEISDLQAMGSRVLGLGMIAVDGGTHMFQPVLLAFADRGLRHGSSPVSGDTRLADIALTEKRP